ncbi:MAG: hypothetical protein R3B47_09250 [Bacteroidia bacterium]
MYTISASGGARNGVITNSSGGNWYLATILDPNLTVKNTSPSIIVPPITNLCVGRSYEFPAGAFDPDGDILQYSLVPCMTSASSSVSYGSGFSATNPLSSSTGVTIDPSTGIGLHQTLPR